MLMFRRELRESSVQVQSRAELSREPVGDGDAGQEDGFEDEGNGSGKGLAGTRYERGKW